MADTTDEDMGYVKTMNMIQQKVPREENLKDHWETSDQVEMGRHRPRWTGVVWWP